MTKDRSLGKVDFNLSDLVDLEKDDDGDDDGVDEKVNAKLARFKQDGLKILKDDRGLRTDV